MGILVQNYSDEELFNSIESVLERTEGYTDSQAVEIILKIAYAKFKKELLSRITSLTSNCKSFVFESEYTEAEWKEIYSLHYANTTYAKSNKVMRVHFFSCTCDDIENIETEGERTNELVQQLLASSFLGYITLRPVRDYKIMLSIVCPNWKHFSALSGYVMSYPETVHIGPYSITFNTFGFFAQDTVLTRCAQANIIMFSSFMHKIYNQKRLKIVDMFQRTRYTPLPDPGLSLEGICEILYRNSIPANFQTIYYTSKDYHDKQQIAVAVVKAYIESRLPVIIYHNQHVVIVIGHTKEPHKQFIVYDDSGVFFESTHHEMPFVAAISEDELFPIEDDLDPNVENSWNFIGGTHERVYLQPDEYLTFLSQRINIYNSEGNPVQQDTRDYRNLLVDNSTLREYLANHVYTEEDGNYAPGYITLSTTNLPHYLWYTEVQIAPNVCMLLIGDPTYPWTTSENIFVFGDLYGEVSPLSQLTEITK